MKNKRIIRMIKILFILIIIWFSSMLIFFPQLLNYEHSLKFLKDKEMEINRLSANIERNSLMVKEEIKKQKSLEKEEQDAMRLKSMLGENRFFVDIDIPSLLVFLEQNAIETDVKININFHEIKKHKLEEESVAEVSFGNRDNLIGRESIPEEFLEENPETGEENLENSNNTENLENNNNMENGGQTNSPGMEYFYGANQEDIQEEDVFNEDTEVSSISGNQITLKDSVFLEEIPDINGLTVSFIPIAIKGNYSNIGNFIRELDAVDYLEPAYMGTYSTGEDVVSAIALFVFHKKGDV